MLDKSVLTTFRNSAVATTDDPIVAAVAGLRIRVVGFILTTTVTPPASITFNTKPAGAGTAISPAFGLVANTTIPVADGQWFQTNIGEGLTVTTGAGTTAVGVVVSYLLVSA
jgi:hypothetical protein